MNIIPTPSFVYRVEESIDPSFVYTEVMATISKRRWNKASILTSFSISKRNKPAYSRTCKDQSEANPAHSTP
jgi:hypothetical protein